MANTSSEEYAADEQLAEPLSLLDIALIATTHFRLLILLPLLMGVLSLGITSLMPPVFTAQAVILLPQQSQSSGAMALQSLGALAGVAGAAAGIKSPADQYVAMMQSRGVEDRLIERFKLRDVYDVKLGIDARKRLRGHSQIQAGKKDGLISIEVDDHDPARAALIANAYVDELTRLTNELAVTEAQQRRKFFEQQLQQTSERFTAARRGLQAAGINEGVMRAEPKAAAENYARLQGEITAAEVRLRSLKQSLTDATPEVRRLSSELQSLRSMAAKTEAVSSAAGGGDYFDRYKDFKYQETLFDLFARQFELAKVDESREAVSIQVIDSAVAPERKSRPKRALIAIGVTLGTGVALLVWLLMREILARQSAGPVGSHKRAALQTAWRRALGARGVKL